MMSLGHPLNIKHPHLLATMSDCDFFSNPSLILALGSPPYRLRFIEKPKRKLSPLSNNTQLRVDPCVFSGPQIPKQGPNPRIGSFWSPFTETPHGSLCPAFSVLQQAGYLVCSTPGIFLVAFDQRVSTAQAHITRRSIHV